VAPPVSWLMDKWKGSIYFYTLSRQFDHELHYLNLATYLEVVLGRTKYHHQDGDISNKVIGLILLDHGSMVDERDPSIFNTLSKQFDHELHYFKVGITHKRH
jgi:hypothetical protein